MAVGSRSVESCSALKPSGPVRVAPWQARQSVLDGMLCRFPGAISATPGTPSAGASTASVPSSFHTYDAAFQVVADVFHNIRVSILRPLKLNSFQNFVPTGKSHASSDVASIELSGGRAIHRRFFSPSDHSGYCGRN